MAAKEVPLAPFKELLEADYKMVAEVVLPATLKEIAGLKQNYLEKYLRTYIDRRLQQYTGQKIVEVLESMFSL